MDVAVFRPLKASWRSLVYEWRMKNNGGRLKRENFAPILEQAIANSIGRETVQNRFRKCGLFPFDQNAISYNTLLTSSSATSSSLSSSPMIMDSVPQELSASEVSKFCNIFEKILGANKLNAFEQCEGNWTGEKEDTNFYLFWKNVKDMHITNEISTASPMHLGNSTLNANMNCLTNTLEWPEDLSAIDIFENDNTLMPIVHNDVPNSTNLSQQKQTSTDDTFNYLVEQILSEHSPEKTGSSQAMPDPLTNSEMSGFPTPFKNSLFWPESGTNSSAKKTIRKKIVPTVATAEEYIEYQSRLLKEKEEKIKKADERKKIRKEKKDLKNTKPKAQTSSVASSKCF